MAATMRTNAEISDSFHISECSDEFNRDVNCNYRTLTAELCNDTSDKNADESTNELSLYGDINAIRKKYADSFSPHSIQ